MTTSADVAYTTSTDTATTASPTGFDMPVLLYVGAAALIVVSVIIHGCLFYRRWRRGRRTTDVEDKEPGWSSHRQTEAKRSSHENSVVSCTDSDQRSRSDSVQLLHEAKSSTKSLLDQDLNERRRSSSLRIKVLPASTIVRSTSGPDQPTEQPSDLSLDEIHKRGSDPQPTKVALMPGLSSSLAPKPLNAEQLGALKPSCDSGSIPNDVNLSRSEQIGGSACQVGSVPKVNSLVISQSGSNRSVPAILQTQPSEEKYDHLEPQDIAKRVTLNRQSKESPEVRKLKRRSYSFDHVPAHKSFADLKTQWQIQGPVRSRSASESQPVPKSVKPKMGASKLDPVYFILEPDPDPDTPSRDDKRFRTLPPIRSMDDHQPTSPIKKKFTLNTLFSRKGRRTEKRKDRYGAQTPPSSPGKSSVDRSAIYEEPGGPRDLDSTNDQDYSLVNPDNDLGIRRDRGKSVGGSPSRGKPSFLKSFHISRSKNKTITTKSAPQKRPVREVCDDTNDAYELLEIPDRGSAAADGPVYDVPGTDPSASKASSNKLEVIGTTTSGAQVRKYRQSSAHRELPSTPNEYDVIERGVSKSKGAISRSKSAKPNLVGNSSRTSTTYDKLTPVMPNRLKSLDLPRRSSSPETNRRDADQDYDLLNAETMASQESTDRKGGKPKVGPKPQSLRGLPRGSEYDLLRSSPLSRHGSIGAQLKPTLAPRPVKRANSLSKLRKVSPDISRKPPRNHDINSSEPPHAKPTLSPKPTLAHEAKKAEPLYFTLDPNSTSEPV